jgi:hypothetical protein
MWDLPHNFPTLRQEPDTSGATRQCVAIIGAGFSHDHVLGPGDLFQAKRQAVEAQLGCPIATNPTDLYAWAGEILAQLKQRNGAVPPKLALAEALGITSDPCWRGSNRDGPVDPRHRVMARFAREGRFESIWSLNWDCLLENALERVGLGRDKPRPDLPWKTHYTTFITVRDYQHVSDLRCVTVFKPHGCVRSLDEAREALDKDDAEGARQRADRFLITADELDTPPFDPQATQQHIYWNLMTRLAKCPLISLGWSASERYFHELVEQGVQPVLKARALAVDELSIIDPKFNSEGHQRLAASYGRTQAEAHVPVGPPGGFTLDALWLWLQALYTVQCLRLHDPAATTLNAVFQSLERPPGVDWLLWWADQWFPAWCRLCWRSGIVACFHHGLPVPPERFDIDEGDDVHVPMNIPNCKRPDLIAAGNLLATLWRKLPQWDFQRFPGALFQTATGRLVLPVPTWASSAAHADRALTPLIRLWREGSLGSVQGVAVLGLGGRQPLVSEALEHWRQALARSLPFAHFTSPESIQPINLTQL